ncbi:MAG: hypothetical protein ABSF61_13700 [Anaerolineales bacterium]|jgi:hypothetical protein
MNEAAFHNYIRQFVREAIGNSDGTPHEALRWITAQTTGAKRVVFMATPNPTEKSEAALAVRRQLEFLAARTPASNAGARLDADEVTMQITRNWHKARFFAAAAMAKALRGAGKNPSKYLNEARSHIFQLRKLGDSSTDTLARQLSELDHG